MLKRFIMLFALGLGAVSGQAQTPGTTPASPELTDTATLDDYLSYAALHNPTLKAEFARWQAAQQKQPPAAGWPDPQVTYEYFVRQMDTRQQVQVMQMIPWPGMRAAAGDAAERQAQAQFYRLEAAKRKLSAEVKLAFADYYYWGRMLAITQKNEALMRSLVEVTRTQYQTGMEPFSTLMRMEVELGKMADEVRSIQDMQSQVVARLNAALNRPLQMPLPVPTQIDTLRLAQTEEELSALLTASNPNLQAMRGAAEGMKAMIGMAKWKGRPEFGLGLGYMDMITTEDVAAMGGEAMDQVSVMATVNIPLWRGKYTGERREAEHNFAAMREQTAADENMLQNELKMKLYEYRDAERKIRLYRESLIPKAEQALNVTQQAFIANQVEFMAWIDAQRTLLEFELAYEQALTNRAKAKAEIENLVGQELDRN